MATPAASSAARERRAAPRERRRPRTKVRWLMIGLSSMGLTVNYVDRALIAATGGSYVTALVLSGGLSTVGALSYLLIVGKIEPLPARPVAG